jgi:hypothetical protein
MYLQTPTDNLDPFAGSLALYFGDIVLLEPKLVEMYDELIGRLDRAMRK